MNEETTAGIRVRVETQYQFKESNPEAGAYVFAYRIRIQNQTDHPVQLLNRHWDITDCGNDIRTVEGEGVVGKQPVLQPTDEFVYISGCQLRSEMGQMVGHYEMIDLVTNQLFEVRVPAFTLEVPFKLN
ncbi:MAG: Co2+/Mg2+ efflux protein ApaG [Sphingobacteriales bacterium]|nr:MAG: Co2+/Mg2+ efflux protein ApaG [Sphingobacteriales bacterium]